MSDDVRPQTGGSYVLDEMTGALVPASISAPPPETAPQILTPQTGGSYLLDEESGQYIPVADQATGDLQAPKKRAAQVQAPQSNEVIK